MAQTNLAGWKDELTPEQREAIRLAHNTETESLPDNSKNVDNLDKM